ncbi:MAG TPA: DUF3311 domain-containing protein [Thermoplasmataceae archaeon]|nr:DUF3311 domain-containing protein [Thermoplasmatales archaeon AK]HLH86366.1 DUF3311 domain-containing protein [Thermoplasmataceae archaeon]
MNGKLVGAGILLVIPLIAMIALPTYNRTTPELLGITFYYWYQTIWLVIGAVLYIAAAKMISSVYKEGEAA